MGLMMKDDRIILHLPQPQQSPLRRFRKIGYMIIVSCGRIYVGESLESVDRTFLINIKIGCKHFCIISVKK